MPQVQPFIGAFHIMRLFFQLPQFFGGQAYAIVGNCDGNGAVRTVEAQADGTALRVVMDAVLYQIVDCP